MKMIEGIKNVFGKVLVQDEFDDNDYYDDYDEYEEEKEVVEKSKSERFPSRKDRFSKRTSVTDENEEYKKGFFENKRKTVEEKSNKITPLKKDAPLESMRVCRFNPVSVKDVNKISDKLIDGFAVILNLEGIDTTEAQRIMDFLFGTVYTISGQFIVISKYVFLLMPRDAYFDGDINEDIGSVLLNGASLSSGEFEIPIIRRDF